MSAPTIAQRVWDYLRMAPEGRETFLDLRIWLRLSRQSLRAALLANPDTFAKCKDGQWRIKKDAPRPGRRTAQQPKRSRVVFAPVGRGDRVIYIDPSFRKRLPAELLQRQSAGVVL